jgi:hypothetical protein
MPALTVSTRILSARRNRISSSTVINSATVWRIPAEGWDPWNAEYGLGQALPLEALRVPSNFFILERLRPVAWQP